MWGGRGVGVLGLGEVEYTRETPRVDPRRPDPPVVCVNRITREHRQEAVMAAMGCVVGVKVSATGYHYLSMLEGKAHCGLLLREGAGGRPFSTTILRAASTTSVFLSGSHHQ